MYNLLYQYLSEIFLYCWVLSPSSFFFFPLEGKITQILISCRWSFLITYSQYLPLEGVSTPGAETQKIANYNKRKKCAEKQCQLIYYNSILYGKGFHFSVYMEYKQKRYKTNLNSKACMKSKLPSLLGFGCFVLFACVLFFLEGKKRIINISFSVLVMSEKPGFEISS